MNEPESWLAEHLTVVKGARAEGEEEGQGEVGTDGKANNRDRRKCSLQEIERQGRRSSQGAQIITPALPGSNTEGRKRRRKSPFLSMSLPSPSRGPAFHGHLKTNLRLATAGLW
jgi:hypothetical protein